MLQFVKISALISFFIFFSCNREMNIPDVSTNIEKNVYLLKDSVITVTNLMTGEKNEIGRFAVDRKIEITKLLDKDEIVYNLDTFRIYLEIPPTYVRKSGSSFPLISFHQDSIKISRHLGGANTQSWASVYGIKL